MDEALKLEEGEDKVCKKRPSREKESRRRKSRALPGFSPLVCLARSTGLVLYELNDRPSLLWAVRHADHLLTAALRLIRLSDILRFKPLGSDY